MTEELQEVMADIQIEETKFGEVSIKEGSLATTIAPHEQFDKIVKYLNYLSHEIDDIGAVAARLINERRAKYNFHFEQNKTFLREYAMEHLKRGTDGEIKSKNYKSLTAGGGIFFRAKPQKINIDEKYLPTLRQLLIDYDYQNPPELADRLLPQKITYEIPYKDLLLEAINNIIAIRAKEQLEDLKQTVEMTEEQAKEALDGFIRQGESEIFGVGGIIGIDEADPFASMHVGTTKAWTGKTTKMELNKAIDGRIVEQDEVNALIEDMQE